MSRRFHRYPALVKAGIVNNRTTLSRWIKDHGFPTGVVLGPNTRAWPEDEVDAWLEKRAAVAGQDEAA